MMLGMVKKILLILGLALILPVTAMANIECMEGVPFSNPADKAALSEAYGSVQDDAKDVMMCSLIAIMKGPRAVRNECGCEQAIDKMCSYRKSKKRVSGPPGCEVFAPWSF